jgi:hypothetical protein
MMRGSAESRAALIRSNREIHKKANRPAGAINGHCSIEGVSRDTPLSCGESTTILAAAFFA